MLPCQQFHSLLLPSFRSLQLDMFAIVDIETTGSHADQNGITEIAIVLHNGKEVEGRYETLINPGYPIPKYVSHLTGITNEMVSVAPRFRDVASNIYNLLQDRIFVAHNVNFDYSFIKHQFRQANIDWNAKKLCTLRLSKAVFEGLRRYGLDHLCETLEIPNTKRHRAGGDADATSILFERIYHKGGEKLIKDFLKKDSKEHILPPNLPKAQVTTLPFEPGVYYFHDARGKVIYVGKAKCIKQRVISHFTGSNAGRKRMEFLRNIHSISYNTCSTEFIASLMESVEIRKLWPTYNVSQKHPEQLFGFYVFEDGRGYLRIAIDKKKKHYDPIASFALRTEAHQTLWQLAREFEIDPVLCFLQKAEAHHAPEDVEVHNSKVKAAAQTLVSQQYSYLIVEQCSDHQSCVLVENGKFQGFGKIPYKTPVQRLEEVKAYIKPFPENETIKTIIRSFTQKYPSRVVML